MSGKQSQRDQLHRRLQENAKLLAEREMQLRFLASELQRKEYATLSLSEVVGALFTSSRSIVKAFEDVDGTTGSAPLDAYIVQLDQVMKIYAAQAVAPPEPQVPGDADPSAGPATPIDPAPEGAPSEDPADVE